MNSWIHKQMVVSLLLFATIIANGQPTLSTFVVSHTDLIVNEGHSNSLSVKLSTQPTGDVVVITAFSSGDTDPSISAGASLIFTPTNWNVAQNVVIVAAEDDDDIKGQAVFQVSASNYVTASFTATEADNDIGVQAVLAGAVSGTYDFGGRDVIIHDVTLDAFDGRTAPAAHSLESPGVSGEGYSSGIFHVYAKSILVDGTIDASAKGYGGGGGGGGGATGSYGAGSGGGGIIGLGLETSGASGFRGSTGSAPTGNGGAGGQGGGFGGVNGNSGSSGGAGGTPNVTFPGGAGGAGGGPFAGSGGGAGANGMPGGYAASGINGDVSVEFELFRGSGGGGGGGGNAGTSFQSPYATPGGNGGASGGGGAAGVPTYAGGGGGGGGAAGGGLIILDATSQIEINATGRLFADGGGRASLLGGYGAGGGIGLHAPSVTIASGSIVRSLGGFADGIGNKANGGTVKVMYGTLTGSVDANLAGRTVGAVTTDFPVTLAISRINATQLEIAWPLPFTGYILESTTNLSLGTWITVTEADTPSENQHRVIINHSIAQRFFRLKNQ